MSHFSKFNKPPSPGIITIISGQIRIRTRLLLCFILFIGVSCAHRPKGRFDGQKFVGIFHEELSLPKGPAADVRLLDVAVVLSRFDSGNSALIDGQAATESIRDAERYFIPQHLKSTLDRSQNWGTVRVVPESTGYSDLTIETKIIGSDGSQLVVEVLARDAGGTIWLRDAFWQSASGLDFDDLEQGRRDVFQGFYNHVANQLAEFKGTLTNRELARIREISTLRFAADLSPKPFAGYYTTDEQGIVCLKHLPDKEAPEWERVRRVQQRDAMFGEVLNGHYRDFYDRIWLSYTNWRHEITVERQAKQLARTEGRKKAAMGAAMIGAAVAIGASGADVPTAAPVILAGAGVYQVVSGLSKKKQIEMHREAIKELTASFATASQPITLDFEGKQYELFGTAKEQYLKWQTILRQLYENETGFDGL